MKRTFGYLLFAFALISGLALLRPTSNTLETTFLPESDGPGNPGFYEQWHLMRQNEAGIVPANYLQTAREQDAARAASGKTVVSPLSNIAELGPVNVGGRTRAMVIDLNDHNHFIAGGISGGLWSSTDQGGTWTSINDQAQSLAVTSLSQDPQHPSDIYFSTGEVRGNSAGIGGDGLYKSTDGGSTFSQLPSTASNSHFNRTWRIQCAPNQAGVVYVATRSGGLYRTKDSGATFSQVFAPFSTTEVSDVEVFADSSVLIGVRTQGIYYSANGDAGTFSQVTSNLPTTGFRRVEIDYCDSFPAIVYAVYEASNGSEALGAWKSTDQGQTWNATGANPENTISYRFPWYCLLLSVKPDDPDFVISGGAQLGYTTDGGQNWSFAGPSHADYHNAVYDLDNPGIVYIGNDGGIYRYSSTSMFFAGLDRNATYNVTQFYTGAYFPNDAIIGGTQDNGTWRSQAGAASFRKVSGGDGAFCAVNQQDPDYSFVSYQRGIIRRSSNSQAFIPGYSTILNQLDNDNDGSVDEGAYFINPFVINLAEGNQVYFTTRDRIWRTTDSGDNWAPLTNVVSGGRSPYISGVSQNVNPTVYIGGDEVFYRVDNAATASPGSEVDLGNSVPAAVSSHFISSMQVYPADSSTLYITFSTTSSQPRIWRVTDGTSSPVWTSVSGDLPAGLPVNWMAFHPQAPDSLLLAATDFGLYSSSNGGLNWVRETDIPNVPVFQVMVRPSDLKVYVFTHGRGVWTAKMPLIVGREAPVEAQFTLYPVPATTHLRVDWGHKMLETSAWSVLNIQGQRMLSGSSEVTEIDVSSLKSGVYFLRITSSTGSQTKSFLKQ